MIENVQKAYNDSVKEATKVSQIALDKSNKLIGDLEEIVKKKILKDDKVLASSVGDTIVSGTMKNMLRANLYVMRASNTYSEIKEILLSAVKGTVIESHSDVRVLRESLKGSFMGDPLVSSEIKTIKHQEFAFDDLYLEFLTNYQKLKHNITRMETLEQFINSGIANLNTLTKFTYNIDYLNRELPFDDIGTLEDKDTKITFDDDEDKPKKRGKDGKKRKKKKV